MIIARSPLTHHAWRRGDRPSILLSRSRGISHCGSDRPLCVHHHSPDIFGPHRQIFAARARRRRVGYRTSNRARGAGLTRRRRQGRDHEHGGYSSRDRAWLVRQLHHGTAARAARFQKNSLARRHSPSRRAISSSTVSASQSASRISSSRHLAGSPASASIRRHGDLRRRQPWPRQSSISKKVWSMFFTGVTRSAGAISRIKTTSRRPRTTRLSTICIMSRILGCAA